MSMCCVLLLHRKVLRLAPQAASGRFINVGQHR